MNKKILSGVVAVVVVIVVALVFRSGLPDTGKDSLKENVSAGNESERGKFVNLSPEALKASNIHTAEAVEREASALIAVTGTVEANQQKVQQVTPLVSGRVERVHVALGDRVQQGTVLAVISSPEVAEMHGKLHQAETRLNLALKNLERVQRAENRPLRSLMIFFSGQCRRIQEPDRERFSPRPATL